MHQKTLSSILIDSSVLHIVSLSIQRFCSLWLYPILCVLCFVLLMHELYFGTNSGLDNSDSSFFLQTPGKWINLEINFLEVRILHDSDRCNFHR